MIFHRKRIIQMRKNTSYSGCYNFFISIAIPSISLLIRQIMQNTRNTNHSGNRNRHCQNDQHVYYRPCSVVDLGDDKVGDRPL